MSKHEVKVIVKINAVNMNLSMCPIKLACNDPGVCEVSMYKMLLAQPLILDTGAITQKIHILQTP